MYKQFYNFKENAFNITSDPSFYFESAVHKEAFAHLLYGIKSRKGILCLTGEVGTGKTTLCRLLLNRIDSNIRTAFVLNPSFSQNQLLLLIARDLGLEINSTNKLEMINSLNQFLLDQAEQGQNVAVIIDEAQNLNVAQLEKIRLLSNLETEKDKLLQIVLVGQPELVDILHKPALRQLNSRISVRYHIRPLSAAEIKAYISHRIKTAGGTEKLAFTDEAIECIFHYSKGTPRAINILCEHALLAGFVNDTFSITEDIIHECAKEALG